MGKTDGQLIIDCLAGDDNAFPVLVNRHLKPVYNFIYRLVGNSQDAEDIAQETFLKTWRNLKKYCQGQSFKTWLFSIGRNTAIDFLRKKKSLVFSDFERGDGENPLSDSLADNEPLPDELLLLAEDKKFLDNLLGQLSLPHKEVLVLRYNSQFTFAEIGKVLGKPLDTVKSQHYRALLKLRKLLADCSISPPHCT